MTCPPQPLPLQPAAPIAMLLAFSSVAGAQQADITWSSSFLATNLDSGGTPLDDSFSFYLGVFDPPPQEPSWTPSAANTAQWAGHWITADVARYDPLVNFRFASGYNLEPLVEGVNLTGKKGYIWGVNRKTPGEWILITGDSWTWPADGGLVFPENWTVETGTAVLGAVNQDGVHMRTAQVSNGLPPLLRPEMWRSLHFTPHELNNQEATVSGWLADPNRDGRTNLVEYALGTNPRGSRTVARIETTTSSISGNDFLIYTVTRDPHAAAQVTPEVTSNHESWLSGAPHLVLESETPSTLVFRDTTPIAPGPFRRFFRLQVTLP